MNDQLEKDIYTALERLANLLRSESRREGQQLGLQAVQFEALHYLSICNRYSDTPLAVTDYLGLTKGTVSQTLKVLEAKGLIYKEKDLEDKRIVHLKLTELGQAHIDSSVPPANFLKVLGRQSDTSRADLFDHLTQLLASYRSTVGQSGFGVCLQCRHNLKLADGMQCGLTSDRLSEQDVQLICKEFED